MFVKPLAQLCKVYYNYNVEDEIIVSVTRKEVVSVQQAKLENLNADRALAVVNEVSERLNYFFDDEEIIEIVQYTIRKCEMNSKDEEYFYILLENELSDYVMRAYINYMGEMNRRKRENVRCVQTNPVQPQMP